MSKTSQPQSPYRPKSNFDLIWHVLFKHAQHKPISKKELLKIIGRKNGKPEELNSFSLSIVCSPSQDGLHCHKSARTASRYYWVDKLNDGMVQMHLRESEHE